ncbi:hypothetical protein SY212_01430 [Ligilactobacillus agilis]|uniref:Uncharacterized protein n=1 Tax=Ligilactobacillus agilis TaxID=1601 RepID=A0A6F9XIL8_9LACO|nr:hypothetical protein [Ligilactobacillus agilis]GET05113.1 hypothetical protein SY212_01430 [Ligilactobacillus agilis]
MSELNLIRRLEHRGDYTRIITNAVDAVYDSIVVFQDGTGLLDDDGYLYSEYEDSWNKNSEAIGKVLDHYCCFAGKYHIIYAKHRDLVRFIQCLTAIETVCGGLGR